jgi:DegV family protein with EDD domain
MAIHIATDSACDLPEELLKKYDIDVVPFVVILDGEEYYDRETIGPDELYRAMRNGKTPKTAQVPYERMRDMFEKYAKQGETLIYIGFSSGLSGTYQVAVQVKNGLLEEYPEFDVVTIDSRGASIGEGFIVLDAARMAKEGKSKEEILERIQFNIDHMEYLFTVDDLEYLQRGGRIGRASAFVGGLLNIKPLIELKDGELIPSEKIRGTKKVYRRMIELLKERGNNLKEQTIGLPHADSPESVEKLKAMIHEATGAEDFLEIPIGPVIGSHAGPGTFAIVFRSDT